MLKYVEPALAARGFSFEEISFREPAALQRLGQIIKQRSAEIFCFYSMNFYIKELALRNHWMEQQPELQDVCSGELYLHQLTGIPLVIHIYDHPLYLLKHESAAFDDAVIFVNGADIIDFMQKHFQGSYRYIAIPVPTQTRMPSLIPAMQPPNLEEFCSRRNEIWCPINLSAQNLSVDGHWALIKALPSGRRERAIRLLDRALYDCSTPLHVVSENMTAAGDPELFVADQLHVANVIKLRRRTEMIRRLIELPLLISSDFVPADLERKYEHRFTRTTMAETLGRYQEFRFSLNSFPLHSEALHDRIINPFLANTVVISDRNALASRLFTDGIDLIFFDYELTSMAAKVQAYLDDPERAYAITVNRYERRIEHERSLSLAAEPADLCDELIQAVAQTWTTRESASNKATCRP